MQIPSDKREDLLEIERLSKSIGIVLQSNKSLTERNYIDLVHITYTIDEIRNRIRDKNKYVCENCHREYDVRESEADNADLFCCKACENGY